MGLLVKKQQTDINFKRSNSKITLNKERTAFLLQPYDEFAVKKKKAVKLDKLIKEIEQ